jgi:hypothetical protein
MRIVHLRRIAVDLNKSAVNWNKFVEISLSLLFKKSEDRRRLGTKKE